MNQLKQAGSVVGATGSTNVKLVPADRAETRGDPITSVDCVLQVTLSSVPRLESSCIKMRLLAVTAVVDTVVDVPAAAIVTAPAVAAPQDVPAQFDAVLYLGAVNGPIEAAGSTVELPIFTPGLVPKKLLVVILSTPSSSMPI